MGPVGDFLDIRVVQLGSHVLILVQLGNTNWILQYNDSSWFRFQDPY